jgi:cyclopropane fatty-acyl-phospholipid synthase-like methyltransferase
MSGTLTTDTYWEKHWDDHSASRKCAGYYERLLIHVFDEFLQGAHKGQTCMEIGCGDSVHLPLIGRRYDVSVAGLDFTENGCRLATERLHEQGLEGAIYQRDLFGANEDLHGKFDYVASFGLVEHFDDPSEPLKAMRAFLKPGGRILTTMPNVSPGSMHVFLQRIVGPKILAVHHLMTADDLRRFHERAGYRIIRCGYEGMGVNTVRDPDNLGSHPFCRISNESLRVVRRSLELIGVWPPGYHLTGQMMACIGTC